MTVEISLSNKTILNNENTHIFNPLKKILLIKNFLNRDYCNFLIEKSEAYGKWTSNRHKNYPTTDIPISDIPEIKNEITQILNYVKLEIKQIYHLEDEVIIDPYDLFIVKYDISGQSGLDIHRDSSEFSFIILLSDPDDFTGGGTLYKEKNIIVNPNKIGSLVVHFGKVYHGGKNILRGKRYILIGFLKTKSKKLMIPTNTELEQFRKDEVCDKRLYDYYWIGNVNNPINISIKIINLKYRKEKLEHILENIKKIRIPENMKIDVDIYEANEGENRLPYDNWNNIQNNAPDSIKKYYIRNITKGEIGCFNSHYDILKTSKHTDYLLILEDDATLSIDFLYRIEQCIIELKQRQWDAINFGTCFINKECTKNPITESLIEGDFFYQTHCILYSKQGTSKIKTTNIQHVIPWDDYLNCITQVHFASELNQFYKLESKFKMYHYYCKLSIQKSSINGISIHDTESQNQYISIVKENCIINKNICEYDLQNWYRIFDVGEKNIENIMQLSVKINNEMWNFDISEIEGSFNIINYVDWETSINKKRKITIVLMSNNNSKLEIFNKKIPNLKRNNIVFFPSYMYFKCENVNIFYANGMTFK